MTGQELADWFRMASATGRLIRIARLDGEGDREFGLRLIEAGRQLCDKAGLGAPIDSDASDARSENRRKPG